MLTGSSESGYDLDPRTRLAKAEPISALLPRSLSFHPHCSHDILLEDFRFHDAENPNIYPHGLFALLGRIFLIFSYTPPVFPTLVSRIVSPSSTVLYDAFAMYAYSFVTPSQSDA